MSSQNLHNHACKTHLLHPYACTQEHTRFGSPSLWQSAGQTEAGPWHYRAGQAMGLGREEDIRGIWWSYMRTGRGKRDAGRWIQWLPLWNLTMEIPMIISMVLPPCYSTCTRHICILLRTNCIGKCKGSAGYNDTVNIVFTSTLVWGINKKGIGGGF